MQKKITKEKITKDFWFSPKSPKDKKFIIPEEIWNGVNIPKEYFLKEFTEGIEEQQDSNSCAGNAICSALEYTVKSTTGLTVNYSRLFNYWVSRTQMNKRLRRTGIKDKGVYLKDSMAALLAFGIPEERYWKFDLKNINKNPDSNSYIHASRNTIQSYKKIRGIKSIKLALLNHKPPVIGQKITDDFFHLEGTFEQQKDQYKGVQSGDRVYGHAMIIVGWDDTLGGFILENSFGKDWGFCGFGFISYSTFKNDVLEAWVIEGLIPDINNIKQNQLSPFCSVKKMVVNEITKFKNRQKFG